MERGMWQGDPLSPFLFLLAAKGLHVMMKEAMHKQLYKKYQLVPKNTQISHLQYADDTIFFGTWDKHNILTLMRILKCFSSVSSLKLNLLKIKLYGVG